MDKGFNCHRHGTTTSASSARIHLILPNPVRTGGLAARRIGSAPGHDHFTEHEQAFDLLNEVGIAGKVLVEKLPKAEGVGRRRSGGSRRWSRRALPGAVGLSSGEEGEVQDN